MGRNFGKRVFGNPVTLLRKLEKGRDHAAPVVEGLVGRPAGFKVSDEPCPGQFRHGGTGKVPLQALEIALYPRQIRLGKQILFALVILDDEEIRDGFRQKLLRDWLAIVREGEFDVEQQRVRTTIQPAKNRLGVMELIVCQPRGGSADAGFALEALDFEDLALGFGLGTSREVLANALAVQPT